MNFCLSFHENLSSGEDLCMLRLFSTVVSLVTSSIIRTSIIRTSIIRTPKVLIRKFFCKLVLEKPIEISVICSNCSKYKSHIKRKHKNNTFIRCYCCYYYKSLLKFTKNSCFSFVVGLSVCQAFQFAFSLSFL